MRSLHFDRTGGDHVNRPAHDRTNRQSAADRALISIVIPVFNEQANINPMCSALSDMAQTVADCDFEFLFVDDGSNDNTFILLCDVHAHDKRFKIIQLSRNYAGAIADSAGLQFAGGDAAVIIPGDLQDHPREIPRLIAKWREGFDAVWAVRAARDDTLLEQLLSRAFAITIRRIALRNYPASGTGGFCLLDRVVIDALNAFPERNRSVTSLALFAGFRQTQLPYHRAKRQAGRSKWSFRRKIKAAVDITVSFSMLPLRMASLAGISIALLTFLFAVVMVIRRVLYGAPVPGLTQLTVIVLFLGGVQLMMVGILGEYLWRTLDDSRRRPLFLVQRVRGDFTQYAPPLPPLMSWDARIGPAAARPLQASGQ